MALRRYSDGLGSIPEDAVSDEALGVRRSLVQQAMAIKAGAVDDWEPVLDSHLDGEKQAYRTRFLKAVRLPASFSLFGTRRDSLWR